MINSIGFIVRRLVAGEAHVLSFRRGKGRYWVPEASPGSDVETFVTWSGAVRAAAIVGGTAVTVRTAKAG